MFKSVIRFFKGLKVCYVCKKELDKGNFYIPIRGIYNLLTGPPTHKSCYDCRLKKAKEMGNPLMVSFPYDEIEKMKGRYKYNNE